MLVFGALESSTPATVNPSTTRRNRDEPHLASFLDQPLDILQHLVLPLDSKHQAVPGRGDDDVERDSMLRDELRGEFRVPAEEKVRFGVCHWDIYVSRG